MRSSGEVGQTARILGQGFTEATSVSFNGTPATFTVQAPSYLKAAVPTGATTDLVSVEMGSNGTSSEQSGTLTSNQEFRVTPPMNQPAAQSIQP